MCHGCANVGSENLGTISQLSFVSQEIGRITKILTKIKRTKQNKTKQKVTSVFHHLFKAIMARETIQKGIQFYKDSPSPKKGGAWVYDPKFEETRLMFGRAFAGSKTVQGEPVYSWGIQHITDSWFTIEENQLAAAFGLGFNTYVGIASKSLIVSKRVDGELASTAIVAEYNPTEMKGLFGKLIAMWRETAALITMLMSKNQCQLIMNGAHRDDAKRFEKKMKHMEHCFEKWHSENGPQEVHWYIKTVGVDPKFNGTGFGRELMEQTNYLADKAGVSCYLECGARNVGFYEKMGYKTVAKKNLQDPSDATVPSIEVYLMIRWKRYE